MKRKYKGMQKVGRVVGKLSTSEAILSVPVDCVQNIYTFQV